MMSFARMLSLILLVFLCHFTVEFFRSEITPVNAGPTVVNGDTNGDGTINLADAIYLLAFIFEGGEAPVACAQSGLTDEQIAILTEVLQHVSIEHLPTGAGDTAKTVRLTGVNLQIVNGLGATNGYPADPHTADPALTEVNGVGNLILGYNETGLPAGDDRTGSHNLIAGVRCNYSTFSGLVVGRSNSIHGGYSAVVGGTGNTASGLHAVACGGQTNLATGEKSVVIGGRFNQAEAIWSSVVGGRDNVASGPKAVACGGLNNIASGNTATTSGGSTNTASGEQASVSGGLNRSASGSYDWVAGSLFEEQ